MRKIATLSIICLVIFFVGGFILAQFKIIEISTYNQTATIVGGVASILGLLGLIAPSINSTDLKTIEVDALKNLAKTAEEIQKKEAELNLRQNSITQLELQQKELEFLVKKASLSLFFKEQLVRYYEKLEGLVDDNKEISRTIKEIKELEFKISDLDIEIEKSPHADSILRLIEKARVQNNRSTEIVSPFDIFTKALIRVIRL